MSSLNREELEKLKHQKMMTQGLGCPVKIISSDGKVSPGEVCIQYFSPKTRGVRALKFLGTCWGFMIISVFIPLAHFVLVPGLFIAGILSASFVYSTESVVLGGRGLCPT